MRQYVVSNQNCPAIMGRVGECSEVLALDSSSTLTAIKLMQTSKHSAIVTLCPTLDEVLWKQPDDAPSVSGFPLRQVSELCGAAGTGKSQLCMQLAMNVQISSNIGGVKGQALYIDTEGSLAFTRLQQIADELELYVARVVHRDPSDRSKPRSKFSKSHGEIMDSVKPETLMQGIRVKQCLEYTSLRDTVLSLPAYLDQNPSVRLVVVDSMAYHLRYSSEDTVHPTASTQQQAVFKRARQVEQMGLVLHRCAHEYNVAVVVTNHATSAPHASPYSSSVPNHTMGRHGEQGREVIPALSDAWAAVPSIRVVLMHAALIASGARSGLPPQISAALHAPPTNTEDGASDPLQALLVGAPRSSLQAAGARIAWVVKSVRQTACGDIAAFAITPQGIRGLKAAQQAVMSSKQT